MSDTFTDIIGIAIAAILLFVFPLLTMSDRTDDVSQLTVKIATIEFVEGIKQSGKVTIDDYKKLVDNLGSTGNTYSVEMEFKILDENPGRQQTIVEPSNSGENTYYSVYTSQIYNAIESESTNYTYYLKEGDIVTVSVKNISQTIAQQLKNIFYRVVGEDIYIIAASQSGIVTETGK